MKKKEPVTTVQYPFSGEQAYPCPKCKDAILRKSLLHNQIYQVSQDDHNFIVKQRHKCGKSKGRIIR